MNGATGDRETRDRLLKAAERLFAGRGFKEVTVREICREAEANVAAVNYHFGDKLGLYRSVVRTVLDAMREVTESAQRAGAAKPPEEQLRIYIDIFLRQLLRPESQAMHAIVNREITDPTPALDDLLEQGVRPRINYLAGVIARMIGCEPSDERVLRCVMSVQAQSIMYARHNPVAERLGFRFKRTAAQIDDAVQHVADFSIAGIQAVGRLARTRV
jgi:TetR/AcrR family transcriptional regulator, regulator of cefoperazone and chloramphenicol sensitivity